MRAIAPYITDKLYDSAVLVMDEGGTYIIPFFPVMLEARNCGEDCWRN